MARLIDFLSKFDNVTIVCHPNADPDCIASSYAIASVIGHSHPKKRVAILAADGLNNASKRLNDFLGVKTVSQLPGKNDVFLLVDISSIDQVPLVKRVVERDGVPYAVLDHHISDKNTLRGAAFSLVKERSSACEVVFDALDKKFLDSKALQALLVGLIYDSRRFIILPEKSIKFASTLIGKGADASLAINLLAAEEDPSEKMAKLKGAARLKLYRIGVWTLSITRVGSFEASVARAMINLGSDVSLVLNTTGSELRLSGRSSEAFFKDSGIDLASHIMQPLAAIFGGQGGGHSTAASANLSGAPEEVISKAMDCIATKLLISRRDIKEIVTKK